MELREHTHTHTLETHTLETHSKRRSNTFRASDCSPSGLNASSLATLPHTFGHPSRNHFLSNNFGRNIKISNTFSPLMQSGRAPEWRRFVAITKCLSVNAFTVCSYSNGLDGSPELRLVTASDKSCQIRFCALLSSRTRRDFRKFWKILAANSKVSIQVESFNS